MTKLILAVGAMAMAIAVLLGAFGAHGLKPRLSPEMLAVYKTGVEYHFYHAMGLLFIGVISLHIQNDYLSASAWLLAIGMLIFSGSLYLLSVTGVRWFGAITPIGGLSFIAGWLMLVLAVLKGVPASS